jgi:hypothetical protein
LNDQRTKYNILGFVFSCVHECSEWEWGRCIHCKSRFKCVDHIRPVYPSEQGVYFPTERIEVSFQHAIDLDFYVHEFTEASIIQILKRYHKDWYATVKFEKPGYQRTYIVHFISLWGFNNNTCLEPVTRKNRPKW